MCEPSKKTENLLGKIFMEIELVEIRQIESQLRNVLFYQMLWKLGMQKTKIFGEESFCENFEDHILRNIDGRAM